MLGLGSGSSPTTEWTFHNQGSLSFDGTDDYVKIDNIADELAAKFDNGEGANEVNFTISMWVKLGTMSTTGVAFNLRVGTGGNNHINLQWHGTNNELRFTCKFNGTSEVAIDGSSGAAEGDGLWWHLVGRATHGGDAELWVNGTKVANQTIAEALVGTTTLCNIGTNTAENAFWAGNIDEVAIWGRAITDAEIATLYNANSAIRSGNKSIDVLGQMPTDLVGYYRFEEKTGTVAINDVGDNGTNTNGVDYSTDIP